MNQRRMLGLAGVSLLFGIKAAYAYTPEQADAGRQAYAANCQLCHGDNLNLLDVAPLVGPQYANNWRGRTAGELVTQLRTTMPPEGPGSLEDSVYIEVAAFLMQVNGAEPDGQALTAATESPVVTGAAFPGPGGPGQDDEEDPTGVIVAGTVENFRPLTDTMLRNPAPGDWPMLRHDYSASSFSPLPP